MRYKSKSRKIRKSVFLDFNHLALIEHYINKKSDCIKHKPINFVAQRKDSKHEENLYHNRNGMLTERVFR